MRVKYACGLQVTQETFRDYYSVMTVKNQSRGLTVVLLLEEYVDCASWHMQQSSTKVKLCHLRENPHGDTLQPTFDRPFGDRNQQANHVT